MSSELPISEFHDPVKIKEEDLSRVVEIQGFVENLNKHRQEIGRLHQALGNLLQATNEIEHSLAEKRRALAKEYNLENYGTAQWALNFEKSEFVRLDPDAPVIP
jgi:hypothetical protein